MRQSVASRISLLRSIGKMILPESMIEMYRRRRIPVAQSKMLSLFNHLMVGRRRVPYQPIQISGSVLDGEREWKERWRLIRTELEAYQASSIIDIGCAEGWFLRRAAEDLGCFAFGIDSDRARIVPSEIARLHDGVERCAIIKAEVGPADIVKLPRCDVILCLSVVHHIVYSKGIEAALAFVKALATRATKAVIFEMGTSEEDMFAKALPPMSEGQKSFIQEFLESAGLTNIREIGETPSLDKSAKRTLFVGEPTE